MKKILHVLTRREDQLAEAVISADRGAGVQIEVIKLEAGEKTDYARLLEAIFEADSVQSW